MSLSFIFVTVTPQKCFRNHIIGSESCFIVLLFALIKYSIAGAQSFSGKRPWLIRNNAVFYLFMDMEIKIYISHQYAQSLISWILCKNIFVALYTHCLLLPAQWTRFKEVLLDGSLGQLLAWLGKAESCPWMYFSYWILNQTHKPPDCAVITGFLLVWSGVRLISGLPVPQSRCCREQGLHSSGKIYSAQ